jgi:hypothetical protein
MLASCVFVIRSLLSSAGRTDRIEAFTQCWADDPNTKFFRNGRKIDIAGACCGRAKRSRTKQRDDTGANIDCKRESSGRCNSPERRRCGPNRHASDEAMRGEACSVFDSNDQTFKTA